MAFFNFRRDGSNAAASAASASQPETAEVVRRRAKHRLIGSAVLVLAGVIGFPLLFDTQPRPVAVDIPIEIPGKNAVKPLVIAKPPASTSSKASPEKVSPDSSLSGSEEILPSKQAVAPVLPAQPAIKNEEKQEGQPEPRMVAKAPDKTAEKPIDRAASRPEAKTVAKPPVAVAEGRMVVQVGAFSDTDKAREARAKLEKAGLKTYTQVADTKDGKRIRVRVGPFATRADAEKAASKIKTLDLPAAILTL